MSFLSYLGSVPSAVISDGLLIIPLWAVNSLSLNETYHLPPVGSAGHRAVAQVHDDTLTLSGLLVGPERFTWKLMLEQLAEASKRGTALPAEIAALPGTASLARGRVGGLILVTALTIRTDIQIQSLSITATAAKRDALEVQLTMAHLPLPSLLGKLLDVASLGVGALGDFLGS
jgi:hypothetical protein